MSTAPGGPGGQHKGKKLGHRRVMEDGGITFKKFETTQLMGSIQIGLQQSIGSLAGRKNMQLKKKDTIAN